MDTLCICISCTFNGTEEEHMVRIYTTQRLLYQARKRLCFRQYFKVVCSEGVRWYTDFVVQERTLFFWLTVRHELGTTGKKARKSSQINVPSTDSSVTPSLHWDPSWPWYGRWTSCAMPPFSSVSCSVANKHLFFFNRSRLQHRADLPRQEVRQRNYSVQLKKIKNRIQNPVATQALQDNKVRIINNIRAQNRKGILSMRNNDVYTIWASQQHQAGVTV